MAKQPAKSNLLDRLVGYMNPVAGMRRQLARQLLTRAFCAAGRGVLAGV